MPTMSEILSMMNSFNQLPAYSYNNLGRDSYSETFNPQANTIATIQNLINAMPVGQTAPTPAVATQGRMPRQMQAAPVSAQTGVPDYTAAPYHQGPMPLTRQPDNQMLIDLINQQNANLSAPSPVPSYEKYVPVQSLMQAAPQPAPAQPLNAGNFNLPFQFAPGGGGASNWQMQQAGYPTVPLSQFPMTPGQGAGASPNGPMGAWWNSQQPLPQFQASTTSSSQTPTNNPNLGK
jgi:hypothetical protein